MAMDKMKPLRYVTFCLLLVIPASLQAAEKSQDGQAGEIRYNADNVQWLVLI